MRRAEVFFDFILFFLFWGVDLGLGFTWIYLDYPRWTGLGLALGSFYLSFFMPFWLWFSYIPLCHDITLFT
jgi:hypothetical protein